MPEELDTIDATPSHRPAFLQILSGLFNHPWFIGAAAACSVISVPLAIYFYLASIQRPNLTYTVSPTKTLLVRQSDDANLQVFHEGKQIPTDVTTTTLTIWNAGKTSIRKEHILEPVAVILSPPAKILDVKVRKTSRSLTEFRTLPDGYENGKVFIDWKILEKNDGAVLQITYAGDETNSLILEGVLEGQASVDETPNKPSQSLWFCPISFLLGLVFFTLGGVTVAGMIFAGGTFFQENDITLFQRIGFLLFGMLLLVFGGWIIWRTVITIKDHLSAAPPF